MGKNLKDTLELEVCGLLEWWFAGNLESGVCDISDQGVCGILEWHVSDSLKVNMSVHRNCAEDRSLFGSWSHRGPRTGGLREGNYLVNNINRQARKKCVQDHLEIREGFIVMKRCIYQQQLVNLAM